MATYAVSNLDFEYIWSGGTAPKQVIQVARRFESILKLVDPAAETLDVKSALAGRFPEVESGARLIAWGWTPPLVDAARQAGLVVDAPPLEVVKAVNSKVFSHRVAADHDLAIAGARCVSTTEGFADAIKEIDGPWIAKHPWGVSGRLQRRGENGELPDQALRWAQKIFDADHALIIEPRLEIDDEFSIHFDARPDGEVAFCGVCRLLTDRRGTFRGIEVGGDIKAPQQIIDGATVAAKAVANRGYFGPVGVDTIVGHHNGQSRMHPIGEINARYTFGRLAIALHRYLGAPPKPLLWRHPSHREGVPEDLKAWPSEFESGRFRLPEEIDPGGRTETFVQL